MEHKNHVQNECGVKRDLLENEKHSERSVTTFHCQRFPFHFDWQSDRNAARD